MQRVEFCLQFCRTYSEVMTWKIRRCYAKWLRLFLDKIMRILNSFISFEFEPTSSSTASSDLQRVSSESISFLYSLPLALQTKGFLLTFICLRATTLSYDVAHRTVRSWRQNSFGCFSHWPWNTLRNYMCGVACCRKEWGEALYDEAYGARIGGGGGGREKGNRNRKLSAVFLQPIQNPSYMSHVLLLCITFLRVLVVLYLRVTCICVA
jgi:hypothetical protein